MVKYLKYAAELRAAKLKVLELEEQYATQLYFETMPVYDPLYKYCYGTSSMSIPYPLQSVDAWIRAVIKHMGLRKAGYGGAATKAVVVSVPALQTQDDIDAWIEDTGKQLRKKVRAKKIVVAA
jgi:hypothetical protein